jgi:oligoribonuclease
MKYVSIDIETTGLDPDYCNVIEFAAVVDDLEKQYPTDELYKFHRYVMHPRYTGEPYALAMHANIFKKLAKPSDHKECEFVWHTNLLEEFRIFLIRSCYLYSDGPKVVVGGKNFAGFDRRFLEKMQGFNDIKWHHRNLDPAMLYTTAFDKEPPSMQTCLQRAGMPDEVPHNALEDALLVVKLLRSRVGVPDA